MVVEITHIRYPYYDSLVIPNAGFDSYPGTGETLKVTQRYTRVDADNLEYRTTIDDATVYTRSYTVLYVLGRNDDYKIAPDLCHENNRNMGNILASARADEF